MKPFLKDNYLVLLIITGLAARLLLASLPGFKIDMDAWFAWALRLNEVGFWGFYSDQIWTNYTPGYLYILAFLGFLKNTFSISDESFYFLLKIPAIIAEVILAILVYKMILKNYSARLANLAAGAILFNPALIFNSSIWGQIDSILALFLLLCIYFLADKHLALSSIFLGASVLIKPQAVVILPVFFLFLIKSFSLKNFLNLLLSSLAIILIFSLPFFVNDFLGFFRLFLKMTVDYSYTSLFAFNLWGAVGFWIEDNQKFANISYQIWGFLLYFSYLIFLTYFYLKGRLSLFLLTALALLAFYFLPTRVHDRYLYPALVFLVLASLEIFTKSKFIFFLTMTLSLIHFINLYYVYIYYNHFFLKFSQLLYLPTLYNLIDQNIKALSIASVVFFILISFLCIRLKYAR